MLGVRTVAAVGLTQMVNWGISFYAMGVFGPAIAADLGWSMAWTYGGLSGALVVMGLSSGPVGRMVDAWGGRGVLAAGSVLLALGFGMLAQTQGAVLYALAWLVLGLGMRMCLYEAAFAALVRAGGAGARRAVSQVTLLGGLASTVFWPLGHVLIEWMGWRGALTAYAGIALVMVPLYWAIPPGRAVPTASGPMQPAAAPVRLSAAVLFAAMIAAVSFLSSGLSAHLIGMLSGLGLSVAGAVALSTLPGIAQSSARLVEVLFGHRMDPLALGVLAAVVLSAGMLAGLGVGGAGAVAVVFVLGYGAGNGLLTVVRGTQPLVLFPVARYAVISGRLIAPSFFSAAAAPLVYAWVIEQAGPRAATALSLGLALTVLGCAWTLWARIGPEPLVGEGV
ncbi:MFS transporter [Antarcticimicrobium luteum]|uniref:MFS transporter n=1 Tax=Antarcticimicrobium luteum TaxID=2547397 RepID=A0A4R5UVD0_9RHOB|nr:MFS transporter [Antarcticimicrobium luteum]TDK43162.1 MFS transporter [Antarcticimicrobium luteum]